jgi:hypothetical protein
MVGSTRCGTTSTAEPWAYRGDAIIGAMRPWARLRDNLATGRNLDLYVTVVIALTIGLLGVFNVVTAEIIAAATLATLALVAIGSLGTRRQVVALEAATNDLVSLVRQSGGSVSADQYLSPSTSGLDVELRGATDIRLVGVSLSRTIRNHVDELERRLAKGAHIKIALIEPGSEAVLEAARRSTIPDAPEIFENRLRPTVDLLRQLAGSAEFVDRLEVRFLRFVPAFGLTMVDPDDADGRIHVDIYAHRSAGPEPVLRLSPGRDPRWYRHFLQEFDRIWNHGRPVEAADGFPSTAHRSV